MKYVFGAPARYAFPWSSFASMGVSGRPRTCVSDSTFTGGDFQVLPKSCEEEARSPDGPEELLFADQYHAR